MNPLLALLITEIVKNAPVLAIDLMQILSKPDAAPADWDALRARWTISYDDRLKAAEARAAGQP